MKWVTPVLVALVVVGAGVAVFQQYRFGRADRAWQEAAEAALDSAADARSVRDAALAAKARLEDSLSVMEAALEERGRRTREMVETGRAVEVPDSCAPFTAWRDRVIDELIAEADGWRRALEVQKAATAELEVAYGAVSESHARLEKVLAARPRPRSRLLPELGAGAFAGITFDGRPALGVGLTLSWEVF